MLPQYTDLIDDHDAIAAASERLLASADDEHTSARSVADRLHELAITVRDHVAVERPLVERLDGASLAGPWLAAWQRGRPAYLALREDWQSFLGDWDLAAIEGDRATFQRDAEAMLSRLEERVTMETRTFYALALQNGGLQFHLR